MSLAKKQLRSQMSKILAKVSSQDVLEQSTAVSHTLRNLDIYKNAKNIGLYMSMDKGEVKTSLIIKNAFEDEKRIFLPRCFFKRTLDQNAVRDSAEKFALSSKKRHLNFYEVENLDSVMKLKSQGPYNLKEPEINESLNIFSAKEPLDLLILPGVAFSMTKNKNLKFNRLGHGAGFYDEFVTRYKKFVEWNNNNNGTDWKMPICVSLALEEQIVDSVPVDDMDAKIDGLLYGDIFENFS